MLDLFALLRFWLQGPETRKWAWAQQALFAAWEAWCREALAQADIAHCSAAALEAHARDRGITRFPGEPEALWRARVRHAFLTAVEMGSRRGFEAILAAHGATHVSLLEREPDVDWDTIKVELDPDNLSIDTELLARIFREWGPVCRRYLIEHRVPLPVCHEPSPASEEHHVQVAA